jgi:hypothetical protein
VSPRVRPGERPPQDVDGVVGGERLHRPPTVRFDPVVCTDATGAVVGRLRVDELAAAAARR